MLAWTNIFKQSIKFYILELIWHIQFIGKLKLKYYESNEKWGCFEVQRFAKPSASNNESSAEAVKGSSIRRKVHSSFSRVCSKLLDFQVAKIGRIKTKIRWILKWRGKQVKEKGGVLCET